jgi:hypothetical protein
LAGQLNPIADDIGPIFSMRLMPCPLAQAQNRPQRRAVVSMPENDRPEPSRFSALCPARAMSRLPGP